ncbi:MAG: hypothetical protein K6F50_06820 [Kiritimatiellae bacterium]|nr:hypothetical protein [Kiritimatiellia bacterium]
MTCHNCPHDKEIARLRQICTKCRLSDHAVSATFSLDAMSDGALEDPRMRARRAAGVPDRVIFNPDGIDEPQGCGARCFSIADMPEDAEEYLTRLLCTLADLRLTDLAILHGLLRGMGTLGMAELYGESKQTISARMKTAITRNPWMEYVRGWKFRRATAGAYEDSDEIKADNAAASRWVRRAGTIEGHDGAPV